MANAGEISRLITNLLSFLNDLNNADLESASQCIIDARVLEEDIKSVMEDFDILKDKIKYVEDQVSKVKSIEGQANSDLNVTKINQTLKDVKELIPEINKIRNTLMSISRQLIELEEKSKCSQLLTGRSVIIFGLGTIATGVMGLITSGPFYRVYFLGGVSITLAKSIICYKYEECKKVLEEVRDLLKSSRTKAQEDRRKLEKAKSDLERVLLQTLQ